MAQNSSLSPILRGSACLFLGAFISACGGGLGSVEPSEYPSAMSGAPAPGLAPGSETTAPSPTDTSIGATTTGSDTGGVGSTAGSSSTVPTSPTASSDDSIKLAWIAPTTKADGTPLSNLAGFRILLGTASGMYSQTITVPGPYTLNYTISGLPASTYFAVVKAFDTSNNESAPSVEVSKTIK